MGIFEHTSRWTPIAMYVCLILRFFLLKYQANTGDMSVQLRDGHRLPSLRAKLVAHLKLQERDRSVAASGKLSDDATMMRTGELADAALGIAEAMGVQLFTMPPMDVCVDALRAEFERCLLYTSPSPRDGLLSRMPSSA